MPDPSGTRRLVLVAASALAFSLHGAAQKHAELDYAIRLEPAFDESHVKHIREALMDNDPACLVWPDLPTQRVFARTVMPIDRAVLQERIARTGLHVVSVGLILPDGPEERRAMIMASMGYPKYIDTGHPELDAQDHAARKASWVAADPQRYEALLRELNGAAEEQR